MPPPRDPKGRTDRQVRRLVKERDLVCVRCGFFIYVGEMFSLQHRKPRGMGGSKDPLVHSTANQILVDGSATTGCHNYIEQNRAESLENGWLIHNSEDPTAKPVLTAQHGWVLLDIDGGYTVLGNGF